LDVWLNKSLIFPERCPSPTDVCFWHKADIGERFLLQCAADASLQDLLYFAAILGIGVTHEAATVH
jgi:hypothetical protein